nr:TonB-dependent receptor [Woeseiaceae bacterium]
PVFEGDATEFGGEVFAGWDSAELGRKLRASLDAGNRRLATNVSLEYLDAGDRRIGGGERIGPSAYESVAGRAALAWTPDTDTRWFLDLHFLEQESTPRVDELVPGFGQTEPSSSEFFFEPNRRLFAHAQYDRANGPWDLDWRLSLAWQRIDDDRRTRDFGADERSLERNRSDLAGAMLTASKQTERGSWLVGFEAYRDEVSSSRVQQDIQTGDLTASTPRFPDGSTVDQAALFVNVDARLSDRHALSGGLRLNAVEVDLPATLVSNEASVDVTDLSGDLGWRYDVTDTWQLVANLGYGFRAPNVFDLGTLGNRPGNRFNVPNTGLDSENVVQLDAGARRRGDDWQFEIMFYALDYDDRITSVSTGATTPAGRDVVQSVNAAESRIQGVEFGATLLLSEHFDLDAVVSYTRGEQTIEGSDEPADRIPPLGGRLQLLYDSGGPLTVTSWLRFADRQDRLSARDIRDVRIDPNGTPGFAIVGTRADWRLTSGWAFSLGVDNILDKRYRNHGSGIDAPGFNIAASVSRQW